MKFFSKLALAALASASFAGGVASAQTQQTWVNGRTDALNNEWTGYYINSTIGGNWDPTRAPSGGSGRWPGQAAIGSVNNGSSTDVAFFGDVASNLTPTIGINHTTTGGRLTLGGIGFRSTNTTFSIGNSSKVGDVPNSNPPSPAVTGILQLNGAQLSTVTGQLDTNLSGGKLIVIADGATRDASIVETNNGGQAIQSLSLGIANGEFYVTSGRQLGMFVAVNDEGNGRGFTKTGTGTMVLARDNNFSGAVTISAGTLQVGTGSTIGDLGTYTGSITNNGALAINRSGSYTLGNVITGAGELRNIGGGTTILTANNSYGTTLISAGTLQVGNGSTTGSLGSGSVTNNGTLTFNRSDDISVGNAIGGSGQLIKNNTNALTLTADHSFTGAVTVNDGKLELGNGGSTGSFAAGAGITVASGATLAVNRSDNVAFSSVIGGRTLSVAGDFLQSGPGDLQLDSSLSVGGSATVADGSLILNAALTATSVNVNDGASLVLGASGSVTGNVDVAATGSLSGFGTITGDVDMLAGGTLTPGSSPGTLSIVGDLLLGTGTILNFELSEADQTPGSGINDLIAVTGDLTLDGTLNVTGLPSNIFANTQKTWTLFTYTGTLTDLGLVLGSLPSGQDGWFLDTSNAGQVNLTAVPEPSSALLLSGFLAGAVALRRRRTV